MPNLNLYYLTAIVVIACGSIPKGKPQSISLNDSLVY